MAKKLYIEQLNVLKHEYLDKQHSTNFIIEISLQMRCGLSDYKKSPYQFPIEPCKFLSYPIPKSIINEWKGISDD